MVNRKYTKKRRRKSLRKLRGGTTPARYSSEWNKAKTPFKQANTVIAKNTATLSATGNTLKRNAAWKSMDPEQQEEQFKVDVLNRATVRRRRRRRADKLGPDEVHESRGQEMAEPLTFMHRLDAARHRRGRRDARDAGERAAVAAEREGRFHHGPTSRRWREFGHLIPYGHTRRSGVDKKPQNTQPVWRVHNRPLPESEFGQSLPRSSRGRLSPRSEISRSSSRSEMSLSPPRSEMSRSSSRSSWSPSSPTPSPSRGRRRTQRRR